MRANFRRFFIIFFLILFSASISHASQAEPRERVSVHLNPDITIMIGDQVVSFFDANGNAVFPIVYQGTTYLPVRAVSAIMGENIEWDRASRTVFIGRTLSNPASSAPQASAGNYVRAGTTAPVARPPVQIVEALVMRDVIIMYNFQMQSFLDVTGREVFPINYQGSNYLPIRAVSNLMGETIEWDAGQRLITISNSNADNGENAGSGTETGQPERVRAMTGSLAEIVTIFDGVTAKAISLQNSLSAEELAVLASYVSEELQNINSIMANIRNVNTDDFTEEEVYAHNRLFEYAEATSFYVLITENIIYMAATGQDFSIFAETFLTFAVTAQSRHEVAVAALRNLSQ